MTFDLEQYREFKRLGAWIVSDNQTVRKFKIQDSSIFEGHFMVEMFCVACKLPAFVFGLDLQEAARIEGELTHALTRIKKDPRLQEADRDEMCRHVRWHRSLYRWVIDGHLEKAILELEAVGAREIPQEVAP